MTLKEKIKNRYNILLIIISIVFLLVAFRLSTLTIVLGDKYREISDNKRVKQIPITAARGEIRDRYGRLLAGNRPSFTVQIVKDEINKNRNEVALKLIKILEEEGENYSDEFPIKLDVITYKDDSEYIKSSEEPEKEIIKIILENKLIKDIVKLYYTHNSNDNNFTVSVADRIKTILENNGITVPILINIDSSSKEVKFEYDKKYDIRKWKLENKLPLKQNPEADFILMVEKNEKIFSKVIRNPIIRRLIFSFLDNRGLVEKFEINDYMFKFDQEYKKIKADLIKNFGKITMDSTAEDDFTNIVIETSIDELISTVFTTNSNKSNKKQEIIPAKVLIDNLKDEGSYVPIDIEIDREKKKVSFKYIDEKSKKIFCQKEEINEQLPPEKALIEIGKKTGLIYDLIKDKNIKYFAQEIVLNNEINPKISVKDFEYVPIRNKRNWLKKYKLPEDSSANDAFNLLRDKYKISSELSKYEARYIMLIIEQLKKQGYRAYQPINIAYGIKPSTVSKIAENNLDLTGVYVSVEPVRYYPMGSTAAHILGYLGKISQSYEIEKYIKKLGYSPNDIIGKTGIEQKFEQYLKGQDGSKYIEVDVLGNTIKVLKEEKAIPGNNVYLTIDAKLQQVAEKALKQAIEEIQKGGEFKSKWGNYNYRESFKDATSGAVVAIDVKTGEVLALASYPAYDPNLFATGINEDDWESLMPKNPEDPLAPRPLYNIAIQTAIQPGSTFKMITALAALEAGIDPKTKIIDMGYLKLGNKTFGCWLWNDRRLTHGPENLYEAIRDSCNYYFYTVTLGKNLRTGRELGAKVEIDDILRLAQEFGLNDKTGIEINIPNEASGGVPNPQIKIITIKRSLRRFLNNNLKNYLKQDDISEKDLQNMIDTIVSWVELENTLTRSEVIQNLSKLGIDPYKENDKGINIADIIKYSYLNQASWKQADTLNISIGQGHNAYTPIQIANYIATLANGGIRHKVSVIDKIETYYGEIIDYNDNKDDAYRIKLKDYSYLDEVKKGMGLVTTEGTARSIFKNFPIKVGGKTGTAQNTGTNPVTGKKYDPYAWFVGFAPYDDPQIAVAVVIFQGGHGGYAAPVAKEVIAQYLGLNNVDEKFEYRNKLVR
ncbi:penicillin-binding transpeptidase domain-containing protein [Caloranaerobacter sp. TR13]|uniref:penicillin-binding transpeptidase domain-containing protein n=1 Tax=Caloranaerobacter sp. TR13 TaxID=1302151 RepID=UPI0006D435CC|nr:penicillin-binding transpeptidase domain-containing protein [Caloranaerobacter sp. TR13]